MRDSALQIQPDLGLSPCLARSLLSILNKFAVLHFPFPAALTGFQYAFSALVVVIMCVYATFRLRSCSPACVCARGHSSTVGLVERVALTDFAMVKAMFPVLLTFYGSVYSNMKARRPPALPLPGTRPSRPFPPSPGAAARKRGDVHRLSHSLPAHRRLRRPGTTPSHPQLSRVK